MDPGASGCSTSVPYPGSWPLPWPSGGGAAEPPKRFFCSQICELLRRFGALQSKKSSLLGKLPRKEVGFFEWVLGSSRLKSKGEEGKGVFFPMIQLILENLPGPGRF